MFGDEYRSLSSSRKTGFENVTTAVIEARLDCIIMEDFLTLTRLSMAVSPICTYLPVTITIVRHVGNNDVRTATVGPLYRLTGIYGVQGGGNLDGAVLFYDTM
jgi:hypothetical protein